jgi:hypothetical protein
MDGSNLEESLVQHVVEFSNIGQGGVCLLQAWRDCGEGHSDQGIQEIKKQAQIQEVPGEYEKVPLLWHTPRWIQTY